MTLKENLALLENLSSEEALEFDTLKSTEYVLGKMLGNVPVQKEPMLTTCCCTPCCCCTFQV